MFIFNIPKSETIAIDEFDLSRMSSLVQLFAKWFLYHVYGRLSHSQICSSARRLVVQLAKCLVALFTIWTFYLAPTFSNRMKVHYIPTDFAAEMDGKYRVTNENTVT